MQQLLMLVLVLFVMLPWNAAGKRVIISSPTMNAQVLAPDVTISFHIEPEMSRICILTMDDERTQKAQPGSVLWTDMSIGEHTLVVKCAKGEGGEASVKFFVLDNRNEYFDDDGNDDAVVASRSIVYGDGIKDGVIAKEGHVYIQMRNKYGQNVSLTHDDFPQFKASVSNDPLLLKLVQEESGAIHLSFVWRMSGLTRIDVSYKGEALGGSPWTVHVKERYTITPGSEPAEIISEQSSSSAASSAFRCAYATLVTTSSFVSGAIVLAHTIRKTGSMLEMIALVSGDLDEISNHVLQSAGWVTYPVQIVPNPNAGHKWHFRDVYTKLHIWNMTQFNKLIFLDSDMMVLKQIDHLCTVPALSATTEINPPALFNAGMLVVEPSSEIYRDMLMKAPLIPAYDMTDQGFLNEYWMGRWHLLPYTYNLLKDRSALQERFQWFIDEKMDEIFVIHMTGEKPWQCYDDWHCNVPGRWAPELWRLWWSYLEQACAIALVSCQLN